MQNEHKENMVLLTLYIKMGNNYNEVIKIHPGDSTSKLAKEFALKHKLNDEIEKELEAKLAIEICNTLLNTKNTHMEKLRLHNSRRTKSENITRKYGDYGSLAKICNYGELLYKNGIENAKRKEIYLENMRKENEEQELEGVTFKPVIRDDKFRKYRKQHIKNIVKNYVRNTDQSIVGMSIMEKSVLDNKKTNKKVLKTELYTRQNSMANLTRLSSRDGTKASYIKKYKEIKHNENSNFSEIIVQQRKLKSFKEAFSVLNCNNDGHLIINSVNAISIIWLS